ncbi:hypothetical protein [Borreliella bavariensis]|uniref:hypothetical protein n=1 Tax=Borreliella bavariensis TaxID=664662 RepID=UPI001C02DC75
MKKWISILNIFLFVLFFYSCLPTLEYSESIKAGILDFKPIKEDNNKNIEEYNKKNIKEDNNNFDCVDEEFRLNEIKEGEVSQLFAGGYVTWVKSGNLRAIKDKNNNLIQDLKGLKY